MAKILIVDDEKGIRNTLNEFLRDAGYKAESAASADDALEILKHGGFDVVVSDIIMPRVSGVAFLQKIREILLNIPVVMMTGEPTVQTAVDAVRAGACDYLTKPVDKAAILRAVSNALRIKDLEDEKGRLEAENQKYQKRLEELVDERTSQLQEAMDRLKTAQSQLIQQERMNALGQMAGGIAHDFNNALMPIAGFLDMFLSNPEMLDDREETLSMLESMRTAGNDAKHIVQRLKQIYTEDTSGYKAVNLAKAMESAVSLTMPKWKEEMNAKGATVEIVTHFADNPVIRGNVSELREALTNLIFNAVDAMPQGGTITVSLKCRDERTAVLEVTDTGVGMDPATVRRCAEPFFTTKGSHGSGLGLSMVQAIAQRHGGILEIDSKPGSGTTMRMLFPVLSEVTGEEAQPERDVPPVRSVNVLVVDDEARSRNIIRHYLENDGHTVEVAESGSQGLELLHDGGFDLVITDRAMPFVSGDEIAAEVLRISPQVPVIMLTGFGDIMKEKGELPVGVSRILSKPITMRDLRLAISSVIKS